MVHQEYCHGTFFEQVGHLLSRDWFFELVEEYRDEKRRIKILKFKRSFCLKMSDTQRKILTPHIDVNVAF